MSLTPMKFKKAKPRYRLANLARFTAVTLVFLLAVTALFVIIAKSKSQPVKDSAVVVTPIVMPTPEPIPTPPPIDIPEGKTMEPVVVVIDAGHGGRDPGTVSPYTDDLYEKNITLEIAKKVEALLSDKGIKTIMTREGDDHLNDVIKEDLLERADIANSNNASLFLSIHVNSFDLKQSGGAKVNGMEVYYMNKTETFEGFTEERFAQIVGDEIVKATEMKFNGVKSNNYSVLRNTKMPAVLVETAYITNKEDHARLSSKDFREKTAKGIAEGILLTLQEIKAFEYDGDMYVFKEIGE